MSLLKSFIVVIPTIFRYLPDVIELIREVRELLKDYKSSKEKKYALKELKKGLEDAKNFKSTYRLEVLLNSDAFDPSRDPRVLQPTGKKEYNAAEAQREITARRLAAEVDKGLAKKPRD